MTTNKHMVSDPTFAAHALTEGGKAVGGAPADPITIRVRHNPNGLHDVLAADGKVLVEGTGSPVKVAVAHLRAAGVDLFTQVKIVESRFDTRIVDGRLGDL
jgi:hypothetical protein